MERWKRQFAALLTVQLLVTTAHGMFIPLLPGFLRNIGHVNGDSLYIWSGVIFSANFTAMMIAIPFLGRIGDRYGRKPVMLWSGFGMAIITACMPLATEPWQLALLRLLQGCFTGILPFTMVLVMIGSPEEKIGASAGTMQMMGETGSLIGPLIASSLLSFLSVRSAYPAMSVFILLATVCVWLFVKDKPRKAAADIMEKRTLLADWKQIWHTKPLPSLLISALCVNFAFVGTNPIMPYYVQQSTHVFTFLNEQWLLGIALSATSFSVIIFSPFLGRLSDRMGPLVLFKLATSTAFFLCLVQAVTQLYPVILGCRFLLGLCVACMMPNIQTQVRKLIRHGLEGQTFAMVNAWMFLGCLLGPLLGGVIMARFGIQGWFSAAMLVYAVSFWQSFRISRIHKQAAKLERATIAEMGAK
ncbi:MFS transporter [Paenibacillus aceris]|uniref:DHA1 family multidrug resistance protein-like MFS transporter n=1 Tax=Paenibacillus aceris TaxID=869555 RepID=A0ABS4HR00_9BACL|nr:MFS transporter [Paenibacillus aceris]MBP1960975.1 DHA1 family multidrug resistance protein-like MFS transporter [Paenibacillus aceris]NHW35359.1 multidrug efflux MFS transporter [Paenibacillus aceris]